MKQKQINPHSQAGFTLVELLAVLAIMTLIMGVLVIDFNSQRGQRSLTLAKNETVTNLRKVQSYILSARDISPGVPAKYYMVTFRTSNPKTYTVQAIDSDFAFHDNVETISLPSSAQISRIKLMDNPTTGNEFDCIQVIFSAPFGKMYTNTTGGCNSSIANTLKDPVLQAGLSQKNAQIYFSDKVNPAKSVYIELTPITGQMTVH